MVLNRYRLCNVGEDNNIIKTDKLYRAKDSLAGAKKAFRDNKSLNIIYILEEDTNQVYVYDTSSFFQEKKSFKKDRYEYQKTF